VELLHRIRAILASLELGVIDIWSMITQDRPDVLEKDAEKE
jgi:hypothetical protein